MDGVGRSRRRRGFCATLDLPALAWFLPPDESPAPYVRRSTCRQAGPGGVVRSGWGQEEDLRPKCNPREPSPIPPVDRLGLRDKAPRCRARYRMRIDRKVPKASISGSNPDGESRTSVPSQWFVT